MCDRDAHAAGGGNCAVELRRLYRAVRVRYLGCVSHRHKCHRYK